MISLKKSRQSREHLEQCAFVEWLRLVGEQYGIYNWFAIPNGGLRDIRVAKKLKKEGVRAGVPDFCIAHPSKRREETIYLSNYIRHDMNHGLYLEFKSEKGRETENQAKFRLHLRESGYQSIVVRSADEAIEVTMRYMRGEL